MSKVKIQGNASGTGIFTVAAPATNTDRTITLPDVDATVLTTAGGTINGNLGVGTSGSTAKVSILADTSSTGLNIRNQSLGSGDGTTNTNVLRVTNSIDNQWSGARYNAFQHIFGTGGSASVTTGMTLNGNGYLTIPNQPMISAGISRPDTNMSGDIFQAYSSIIFFDVQTGITFNSSNGRFTVPVAGKYFIGFYSIKNGSSTLGYVQVRHNDGNWLRAYSSVSASGWATYAVFGIKSLGAGDYINAVSSGAASDFNLHGYEHMRLVIYLIG